MPRYIFLPFDCASSLKNLFILFNLTARSVDLDNNIHGRRYQNSDTGYASQYDTGLEAALRRDQTSVHQHTSSNFNDRTDLPAWKANPVERRSLYQDRRSDHGLTEDRRRRRRTSALDCSVITRSSTTMITKVDQKNQINQVCRGSGLCLLKIKG